MKIYEYSKCSTCRKALSFLDKNKVTYKKHSIVDTPPSVSELKKMLLFLDGNSDYSHRQALTGYSGGF